MRRRSGFTLIEILLATILTAMLMVGVLAVIVSVSGPIKAADGGERLSTSLIEADRLIDVLMADLAQARSIEVGGGEISVMSYSGLDAEDSKRTQRPVRVRYRVVPMGEQSWLVREEQALDEEARMAGHRELVASGVSRIALDPPKIEPVYVSTDNGHRVADGGLVLPADGLWRLRLWGADPQQPIFDLHVVLPRSLAYE